MTFNVLCAQMKISAEALMAPMINISERVPGAETSSFLNTLQSTLIKTLIKIHEADVTNWSVRVSMQRNKTSHDLRFLSNQKHVQNFTPKTLFCE